MHARPSHSPQVVLASQKVSLARRSDSVIGHDCGMHLNFRSGTTWLQASLRHQVEVSDQVYA